MNIVIRIYLGMIVAFLEDETGQFTNRLGTFSSVEGAAMSFNGSRPVFVEDCLFDSSNGIRRYRVRYGDGADTQDYCYLEPANEAAAPARQDSRRKGVYFETNDGGCLLAEVNGERLNIFPHNIHLAIKCNAPGSHPHEGTGASIALAVRADMSDPSECVE